MFYYLLALVSCTAMHVYRSGFFKPTFLGFLNLKILKSANYSFLVCFTYCVTNLMKMVFKYKLQFVAFTWPNLCPLDLFLLFIVLVGRNFVSGVYKLKPKGIPRGWKQMLRDSEQSLF